MPYVWDPNAARYRGKGGQFVPRSTVVAAVGEAVAGAKQDIAGHCAKLQTGAISLADWQTGMAGTIRSLHTAMAAAGKGGWDQCTPADWGRVGLQTRHQYAYLAKFATEIEAGQVDIASGAFLTRAGMYADAARQTYQQAARAAADASPRLTVEYNILGNADHCADCLAATAAGFVPIGTLKPPGARLCRTNCKCNLGYK